MLFRHHLKNSDREEKSRRVKPAAEFLKSFG